MQYRRRGHVEAFVDWCLLVFVEWCLLFVSIIIGCHGRQQCGVNDVLVAGELDNCRRVDVCDRREAADEIPSALFEHAVVIVIDADVHRVVRVPTILVLPPVPVQ